MLSSRPPRQKNPPAAAVGDACVEFNSSSACMVADNVGEKPPVNDGGKDENCRGYDDSSVKAEERGGKNSLDAKNTAEAIALQ